MEGIAGPVPASLSPDNPTGLIMLKKSQDLMAHQASALLATLPAPRPLAPGPPGVGGRIDLSA